MEQHLQNNHLKAPVKCCQFHRVEPQTMLLEYRLLLARQIDFRFDERKPVIV
jgi:hypothetical protein